MFIGHPKKKELKVYFLISLQYVQQQSFIQVFWNLQYFISYLTI